VGVGRCIIALGSLNLATKFQGCLSHRVGEDMCPVHEGKGSEPSGQISKTINAEAGVRVRMADKGPPETGTRLTCFQSLSRPTPNCESAASERYLSGRSRTRFGARNLATVTVARLAAIKKLPH
jgi:hypothetical protein